MMKVVKFLWWLVGLFVVLQYLYWAAMEVGYGLNLCAAPAVDHGWLFLAFVGAAFTAGDLVAEEAKRIFA